ncbi:methyltransferase [Streptomyces sp. NBC_01390]|uniref:methyltransferase n=1 Tax=Streptomyces sp. NBC_01390 TaxID=2903850 RepID=UPI0032498284
MTTADASPPEAPATAAAVFQMITGHYVSTAINSAARIELADAIGDDTVDHAVLAQRTGTHPESLLRLLYLLASAGLVHDAGDGRFALTDSGRLLRKDGADSLHAVALLHAGPGHIQRWFALHDVLKSAPKIVDSEPGGNPFAAMPPHVAAVFNRAMTFFTRHTAQAVLEAYDFTRFGTLADVGGGEGSLLAAILRATPGLRGILFDLPSVVEDAAERTLAEAGVLDRCEIVGGDFFAKVPPGADAYLLKNVIHDWDDTRSRELLANVREAMAPGSRVLLVESVRPERFGTSLTDRLAAYGHLGMLLNGGAERSRQEYEALFASARLTLSQVVPVRPAWTGVTSAHVIEAVPA